ncbi:PREDICTED: uncharacterized protein LOC106814923 [Priapulus caudatus]|uniref:Uncharacterized protein LOC106814923 n=1 Tax=Priapulus caudatus TaxID=37621 RepID=A0ABM1ERH0_PRICU|nr:PREDICTED: uncharacterized protein LOC106814923 [Priapulus caudatus]
MELSKELDVASSLNNLRSCNLEFGANAQQWQTLVEDYFCAPTGTSPESDEEVSDEGSDECELNSHNELKIVGQNELGLSDISSASLDGEAASIDDGDVEDAGDDIVFDEIAIVMENVSIVNHEDYAGETEKIVNFTCVVKSSKNSCCLNDGNPCCTALSTEFMHELRTTMSSLPAYEKDLILLGKLSSGINMKETTASSKRKRQTQRKHQRTCYCVEGTRICRETFKFLHCISQDKLTALLKHYKEHGLTPRHKKSGGKQKTNARFLTFEDVSRVVTFIVNFSEVHALVLPGRVPGFKRFDIKLLPSMYTKASIWRLYQSAMNAEGYRAVKVHSFRNLWRSLVPYIVMTKPMTDLCWTCQKNNSRIYRSMNIPEAEKSAELLKQQDHLVKVTLERTLYQDMVKKASNTFKDSAIKLGKNAPMSRDIKMHYSFDYAQQVHYPNDPYQPGPMYFLVPRKCGIFGVACEAVPQQVNFVIDEAVLISKGANAVISYLDYFFDHYGFGEKDLELHCDNCSGQNKNNFMLWYLAWRIINGLHRSISLNFLVAGHTKFAPDWCFGLVKQKYRRTMVSSLDNFVDVVNSSTIVGTNIAQKVGTSSGDVIVPYYDWNKFLSLYFRTVPGIKKFQHFRFDAAHPGEVFRKEYADSAEENFQLLRDVNNLPQASKPGTIPPPGLSYERKLYLFDKIREFCSIETRDITCPAPGPAPAIVNDPAVVNDFVARKPAKRPGTQLDQGNLVPKRGRGGRGRGRRGRGGAPT